MSQRLEEDAAGNCFLDPQAELEEGSNVGLRVERKGSGFHVTVYQMDGDFAVFNPQWEKSKRISRRAMPVETLTVEKYKGRLSRGGAL